MLALEAATDNLYPALFHVFTVIICGYVAGRLNIVSSTESKGIGTFVGTFALPSLIFLSLAKLDFSTVNWTFLLAILVAKGVVFFAVIIITLLVTRPPALGQAGIFAIFCTQSNDFALGYPIINAIYEKTHPEYALLLYLMAPISLAILNPFAFVLMEINKQREVNTVVTIEGQRNNEFLKLSKQIIKGIALNPVLIMTVLGIIGNIVFKHQLSIYIEGLLQLFGNAFSAASLFLLGLRMVGQIHRLKGPALVLPCVLIMVKEIVLPVVMREAVSILKSGGNETETQSLSTYAFLYGTVPTAPAVFVFSNLYQLEIDLMASSMVICTFISGPIMFISAKIINLNKDYADELKSFGFNLSIVALIAGLWVLFVFIVTKKHRRMPHRLTLCLLASQILLSISVISSGPHPLSEPSWQASFRQAALTFSMYSSILWTSMLAVGLLLLQSRGPCFLVTLFPVLCFVAWGAPAIMITVLLLTEGAINEDSKSKDALRLFLLVFCIIISVGSLILYLRYRRRSARIASLSADVAESTPPDESTGLVDSAEPVSNTQSLVNNGCYGTITATPSPLNNGFSPAERNGNGSNGQDIEDITRAENNCTCPCSNSTCNSTHTCNYLNSLELAASELGLLPPEQSRGRGSQTLKHTVLIIVYTQAMFIGITYTTWRMMMKDESGVFIEIEFLDIAANYGQALIMFILFGLDPQEIALPVLRYFKRKWHGADTVVLPDINDLSFETKHVCDQFITHHLERCKEAIAKDTRWRMRNYPNVFRGSCLVQWLIDCGLAKDENEAVIYGKHLLDGRLIAHVNNAHHFTNTPLLYAFK